MIFQPSITSHCLGKIFGRLVYMQHQFLHNILIPMEVFFLYFNFFIFLFLGVVVFILFFILESLRTIPHLSVGMCLGTEPGIFFWGANLFVKNLERRKYMQHIMVWTLNIHITDVMNSYRCKHKIYDILGKKFGGHHVHIKGWFGSCYVEN